MTEQNTPAHDAGLTERAAPVPSVKPLDKVKEQTEKKRRRERDR